jgi:hypothetical protein
MLGISGDENKETTQPMLMPVKSSRMQSTH